MSIFEFDDQQGVRTRGTLRAPGATPGDVLTVGTSRGAVSPSPSGGSQTVTKTVDLTSEQFQALNSAPVEIVATPGPNKLIVPLCVALYYTAGTTQFAFASQSLLFVYDTTDTAQTANDPGPPILVQDAINTAFASVTDFVSVLYSEPINLLLDPAKCVDKPLLAYANVSDPPGGPIVTSHVDAGGAGYAHGDTGTVTFGGFSDATYTVDTVDGGGGVLAYTITNPGTGYTVQDGVGTTADTGAGDGNFTIDVTAVDVQGDSLLRVTVVYYLADTP